MDSEIQALEQNETWEEVERPGGLKPLHNKWVYVKKKDLVGNVARYKSRFVACGNEQRWGVDFDKHSL